MKRYLTILLLLNVVAMTASAREVFPINEGWRFFFKSEKTSDNARHVTPVSYTHLTLPTICSV